MRFKDELKCKRDLMKFALLCVLIFIIAPIGLVILIRYDNEIDVFFDLKTQTITFMTIVLSGSLWFLIRWYKRI